MLDEDPQPATIVGRHRVGLGPQPEAGNVRRHLGDTKPSSTVLDNPGDDRRPVRHVQTQALLLR